MRRSPKRRLSEVEAEDDGEGGPAVLAREAGAQAYKAWRDSYQPPPASIAMRSACPYRSGDPLELEFARGWRSLDKSSLNHVWCGARLPERKGQRCCIIARRGPTIEVEFEDGEVVRTKPQCVLMVKR